MGRNTHIGLDWIAPLGRIRHAVIPTPGSDCCGEHGGHRSRVAIFGNRSSSLLAGEGLLDEVRKSFGVTLDDDRKILLRV